MNEQDRLYNILMEQGSIGRKNGRRIESPDLLTESDGVTRPAGTENDKKTRDYFVSLCRKNGFEPFIDIYGNIFITLPGKESDIIMMGSHLDSVIDGGMFDGAMGVFSALEVLIRLREEKYKNRKTIVAAAFTGEEGSAFHQPMLGSHGYAGLISKDDLWKLKNRDGKDFKSAMQDIGYLGTSEFTGKPGYYIEYHIEQGPMLEKMNMGIGIVTSITGQCVIRVNIKGIQGHSGTTPMDMRDDALVKAAAIIKNVNSTAMETSKKFNNHSVGTVGELNVEPNRFNVIPGHVCMKIDLRSEASDSLHYMKDIVISYLKTFKAPVQFSIITDVEPSIMSDDVINAIEKSLSDLSFSSMKMPSGAGHDAIPISKISEAGMIFVPSHLGLSHTPLEWTDFSYIEKGVQVLLGTVKNLDAEK